ncbi:AAA family ATPase [archaeon]|nr:AAA family ATPase [archaeon]
MKIVKLSLENYRNFEKEATFKFNDEINFIIGENNLGKSNILKLFDKIFNSNSLSLFNDEDFYNSEKEIIIKLKLKLDSNEELGIFEDNFSPEEEGKSITVGLRITQNLDEETIISCIDTDAQIKRFDLKKFNLFYIDSTGNKNTHLKFIRKYGVDGSLGRLLEKCMNSGDKSKLIAELGGIKEFDELKSLLAKVNNHFSKLYISNKHQVCVGFEDLENLICNLFSLKESTGIGLEMSGQGLKSLLYLELAILYKLLKIQKQNRIPISNFNSIIAIDEPEVHLHNYQQRCFIKYLLKAFKFKEDSTDNKFKDLVSDLFDIKSLDRQIFVATHSADILSDKYKQITRFYRSRGELKIVSGENIDISEEKELKHYLQHIKEFKEAFFCKGLIICEGDTEIGSLMSFFNKKGKDLDDLGISILPAGSCDNISKIKELCNKFGIPSIGIRDRDNLSAEQVSALVSDDIYCTDRKDFEEEFMGVLDKTYFMVKAKENLIFTKQINQVENGTTSEISDEVILRKLESHKDRVFRFKCAECLNVVPPCFDRVMDKIMLKVEENEPNTE